MKKIFVFLVIAFCVSLLFAGGTNESERPGRQPFDLNTLFSRGENKESEKGVDITVALLTDAAGIDDKSFNAAAWRGILEFYGDNGKGRGTLYQNITAQSGDQYIPNLRNAAEAEWTLIVTTGFSWGEATGIAAGFYPDQKFVIIDVDYLPVTDNLIQYIYQEEQGSYLVGLLAALQAKADGIEDPKFGFIGGIAGSVITRFEIGYIEGIRSVFPDAEIFDFYANDWGAPDLAKTVAKSWYDNGVYCIFSAAGPTGNGTIAQAKEYRLAGRNVWAIGVDSDQYLDGVYGNKGESSVLTSSVKMVENSILDALNKIKDGTWKAGVIVQNMANGGVGYSKRNPAISDETIKAVDRAAADIISGRIQVSKTYAESLERGIAPYGLAAIDD